MGRTGRRIGERYRLVEKLGAGGMSEVWRAVDDVLGREVAVKVLTPQQADDSARDRMRHEALAAARLCHPHITSIFDFGETPLPAPYVVMELNDGESVAARMRRDGPLPWRAAVTMAAEVASALATAHARGIVHRDVTPANVMLTQAGAKVVDFGISALIGQRDAAPDGSLLGTPAYLAPERLAGAPVSPATDVYALGVLLHRALTGRLPWPADNTAEALRAHLYAEPDPLPHLPGMPAEVAALCLRCLAKSPADRPDAAEVARRLGAAVGVRPVMPPVSESPTIPLSRGGSVVELPLPWPGGGFGRPRSALRRLRLRAGLRLLPALRLGTAEPLGGGLFRGGSLPVLSRSRSFPPSLPSPSLPSPSLPSPSPSSSAPHYRHPSPGPATSPYHLSFSLLTVRHRIQAGVATAALLAAVGVGWSASREPADVGPAQASAAGAGTAAGVAHTAGCTVRYRVEKDSGSDFEARVTVVNNGEYVVEDWRVEFAYPGTQRLTDPAQAVDQNGRRIVFRGGAELGPGRSASVLLRGAYRGANPLPLLFTLDGHRCEAQVLGARTQIAADPAPAATRKRQPSPAHRPAPAKKVTKAKPAPKKPPPATTPPARPARPTPEPMRVGGFSVAA